MSGFGVEKSLHRRDGSKVIRARLREVAPRKTEVESVSFCFQMRRIKSNPCGVWKEQDLLLSTLTTLFNNLIEFCEVLLRCMRQALVRIPVGFSTVADGAQFGEVDTEQAQLHPSGEVSSYSIAFQNGND